MYTGAAPIPTETLDWYKQFDLTIREVYGMTENNGGCTLMPANSIRPGTVGTALNGVELKIDPTTKEILTKAPWLMNGYYKDSDKSSQALADGWLHTGDIGEIDDAGYLKLTGRLNDTFKTAKGKFITPLELEYEFAVNNDIEMVCVTGSHLAQPIALCVMSEIGQAKAFEEVKKGLLKDLYQTNNGRPNYMKVAKVIIIQDEWSIENGLLTPTLKIKRNELYNRYKDEMDLWMSNIEDIFII